MYKIVYYLVLFGYVSIPMFFPDVVTPRAAAVLMTRASVFVFGFSALCVCLGVCVCVCVCVCDIGWCRLVL